MADLTGVAWNKFPRKANPADQVAAHFQFYELTKSELAARLNINNAFPGVRVARAAVFLCRNVMEPVRAQFGPFTPNSVYRCQDLERALKGKRTNWTSTSQHTLGQACDIEIAGVANADLADWIRRNLEFDQLILECYNPQEGENSGWVHVSRCPPGPGQNRREVLSYIWDRRTQNYVYVEGLQATA